MNAEQSFQLWLVLLTIVLGAFGVVIWWFVLRVIDMPEKYATKSDLQMVADDWKGEMTNMRQERRDDNVQTQSKLDRIAGSVTGIHQRIDTLFNQRQQ